MLHQNYQLGSNLQSWQQKIENIYILRKNDCHIKSTGDQIMCVCVRGGGGRGGCCNKTWMCDIDVHQKFAKEPSKGIGILFLLKEHAEIKLD